jgi:hypothetical protein
MKKIHVYTKERGVKTLREGVTFEQYKTKVPLAIKVEPPSDRQLEKWLSDCGERAGAEAVDGCWTDSDGDCFHGYPSWLKYYGMI